MNILASLTTSITLLVAGGTVTGLTPFTAADSFEGTANVLNTAGGSDPYVMERAVKEATAPWDKFTKLSTQTQTTMNTVTTDITTFMNKLQNEL
jgi:hypothetical protein